MSRLLFALVIAMVVGLVGITLLIAFVAVQAILTSAQANLVQTQAGLASQCLTGFMLVVALLGGVAFGAGGIALRLALPSHQNLLPVSQAAELGKASAAQPRVFQPDYFQQTPYPIIAAEPVENDESDRLFAGWGW